MSELAHDGDLPDELHFRRADTAPVKRDCFGEAGRVPVGVARLAYQAYAAAGHPQTFYQVHQRGGFSWGEIVALLRGPAHYDGAHLTACFRDCGKDKELPR